MHLHKLRIANFRAIENIDVEFDSLVSVIIGPNAIGKTTILEAIRLAKSVLAPRTQNESAQTLQSLGVTSPHMPQRLFPAALTTNPDLPTTIKCAFKVENSEIASMEQFAPQLAAHLALQSIGLNFANPVQAMGFLNSPQGIQASKQAQIELTNELGRVADSGHVYLRQLQRHCLENYLLDAEIITDLTREKEFSAAPLSNVTDTTAIMKRLALAQLNHVAARDVFKQLGLESVGFDFKALNSPDPAIIAASLWARIELIRESFDRLGAMNFDSEFRRHFEARLAELTPKWDDKWRELCDGKLLFVDMRSEGHIRGDLLRLKRKIAVEMRLRTTETWNSLDSLLKDLVAGGSN
jgi:hypothetical protein